MLFIPHWCGVFLQGVLFLLPLLFFVYTTKVSIPYKDYHEKRSTFLATFS